MYLTEKLVFFVLLEKDVGHGMRQETECSAP